MGSWLVPARLRPAVLAIYRFARHADDLADEGDAPAEARDAALLALDDAVVHAAAGEHTGTTVVDELVDTVERHRLHWQYFRDLIDAFRQDLHVSRYADTCAVLDYCRRSANPIGRLMLQLFEAHDDERNLRASDAICSALQRINFLQDIGIDARKNRIYVPQTALSRAGVEPEQFLREALGEQLGERSRQAVAIDWAEARAQLLSGSDLPSRLPWRLSAEIRFILSGGHRILDRIARAHYDSVACRPQLGWSDAPALLYRAVILPSS